MWRRKGNSSGPDQATTSVIDKGCELEGRFTFAGKLMRVGNNVAGKSPEGFVRRSCFSRLSLKNQ